ncbi:hypothetical protein PIB30_066520, partial [Stylosanthes scabra]|nr:hypothetical protein [Stylosanthes scabra]
QQQNDPDLAQKEHRQECRLQEKREVEEDKMVERTYDDNQVQSRKVSVDGEHPVKAGVRVLEELATTVEQLERSDLERRVSQYEGVRV